MGEFPLHVWESKFTPMMLTMLCQGPQSRNPSSHGLQPSRRSHFAKGSEFCYSALTLPGKPHSNISRCKAGSLLASVDLLTGVMALAIVSGEAT